MSDSFEIGEVCFAKIKGYVPWPAKVYEIARNGQQYRVIFYAYNEINLVQKYNMHKYITTAKNFVKKYKLRKYYSLAIYEANEELKSKNLLPKQLESLAPEIKPNDNVKHRFIMQKTATYHPGCFFRTFENAQYDLHFKFPSFLNPNNPIYVGNSKKIKKAVQLFLKTLNSKCRFKDNNQPVLVCRFTNGEFFGCTFYDTKKIKKPFDNIYNLGRSIAETFELHDKFYLFAKEKFEKNPTGDINIEDEIAWWKNSKRQLILTNELISSFGCEQYFYFCNMVVHLQSCYDWDFVTVEENLVNYDIEVKTAVGLNFKDVEVDKALMYMKRIKELKNVKPIMLIKRSDVAETFRKMCHYTGNLPGWNLKGQRLIKFKESTEHVRKLSASLIIHFKKICGLSEDANLKQYLEDERNKLMRLLNFPDEITFYSTIYSPDTLEGHFYIDNKKLEDEMRKYKIANGMMDDRDIDR